MSNRIPVGLQQVFLASQKDYPHVENVKVPASGVSVKQIKKPVSVPAKIAKNPAKTVKVAGATALRSNRNIKETAAEAFRKANPAVVKKKYPADSPQAFLDNELKARGYSLKKYVSMEGGYYSKPTLLQKASFGSTMNDAIITSDAPLLRRLLDAGLSPNPCNAFGESLIHRVCRRGDHKLLSLFLEKGCSLQITDDYGRTPLHDAMWKADPSPEVVSLILNNDKHLIRLMDIRGFVPLDYVRKEAWPDVIEILKSKMDEFFPQRDANAGNEGHPPLTKKKPDSTPIPDPRMGLSPQSAALVANGEITPEDGLDWDEESDSEYDSDDSYSDSDDESIGSKDGEDYYDDEDELTEFCMRAGGPLAIARNCFGQTCQVMSGQRKLN
jgi:ankyrin repeat protein